MELEYIKSRFTLELFDETSLSNFKSSQIRGLIGKSLRKLVCATKAPTCEGCVLSNNCIYPRYFEDLDSTFSKRAKSFLVYFVPDGKTRYSENDLINFDLTLIGKGIEDWSYFFKSILDQGEYGIGNATYDIKSVISFNSDENYNNGSKLLFPESKKIKIDFAKGLESIGTKLNTKEELEISFTSPLRFKKNNTLSKNLTFPDLVHLLFSRIEALLDTRFNSEFNEIKNKYFEIARTVVVILNELEWKDFNRHSFREQSTQQFGGLVGQIRFGGDVVIVKELLQWVKDFHLGSKTTFGFGHYVFNYHKIIPVDVF